MWQKARITRTQRPEHEAHRLGRDLWVRAQPPEWRRCQNRATGDVYRPAMQFFSNIADPDGLEMLVLAECVELLPEFAEHVAMVPLSDWDTVTAH